MIQQMKAVMNQIENMPQLEAQFIETWKTIVSTESYTRDAKSIDLLGDIIEARLISGGMETKRVKFEQSGGLIIGTMGDGERSEGIILTGHYDTVFKTGTLETRPFHIENDLAYGPGVLDMKGGVTLIIHIVETLKHMGYTKPVKVILCGDEEHGHAFSNSATLMMKEAEGYKCAFNMETGLLNRSITTSRKGRIGCSFKVKGKSAHAGANFHEGINAIHELANIITRVNALNEAFEEATFSVGIIRGGHIANAIPDEAEAEVDVRFLKNDDGVRIREALEAIAASPEVQGAVTTLSYESSFPPFEATLNQRFFEKVSEVSEQIGFGAVSQIGLGGSSDASYFTVAGVPCLCSMGVVGEWNHTSREYAVVSSAMERLKLVVMSIYALDGVDLSL